MRPWFLLVCCLFASARDLNGRDPPKAPKSSIDSERWQAKSALLSRRPPRSSARTAKRTVRNKHSDDSKSVRSETTPIKLPVARPLDVPPKASGDEGASTDQRRASQSNARDAVPHIVKEAPTFGAERVSPPENETEGFSGVKSGHICDTMTTLTSKGICETEGLMFPDFGIPRELFVQAVPSEFWRSKETSAAESLFESKDCTMEDKNTPKCVKFLEQRLLEEGSEVKQRVFASLFALQGLKWYAGLTLKMSPSQRDMQRVHTLLHMAVDRNRKNPLATELLATDRDPENAVARDTNATILSVLPEEVHKGLKGKRFALQLDEYLRIVPLLPQEANTLEGYRSDVLERKEMLQILQRRQVKTELLVPLGFAANVHALQIAQSLAESLFIRKPMVKEKEWPTLESFSSKDTLSKAASLAKAKAKEKEKGSKSAGDGSQGDVPSESELRAAVLKLRRALDDFQRLAWAVAEALRKDMDRLDKYLKKCTKHVLPVTTRMSAKVFEHRHSDSAGESTTAGQGTATSPLKEDPSASDAASRIRALDSAFANVERMNEHMDLLRVASRELSFSSESMIAATQMFLHMHLKARILRTIFGNPPIPKDTAANDAVTLMEAFTSPQSAQRYLPTKFADHFRGVMAHESSSALSRSDEFSAPKTDIAQASADENLNAYMEQVDVLFAELKRLVSASIKIVPRWGKYALSSLGTLSDFVNFAIVINEKKNDVQRACQFEKLSDRGGEADSSGSAELSGELGLGLSRAVAELKKVYVELEGYFFLENNLIRRFLFLIFEDFSNFLFNFLEIKINEIHGQANLMKFWNNQLRPELVKAKENTHKAFKATKETWRRDLARNQPLQDNEALRNPNTATELQFQERDDQKIREYFDKKKQKLNAAMNSKNDKKLIEAV